MKDLHIEVDFADSIDSIFITGKVGKFMMIERISKLGFLRIFEKTSNKLEEEINEAKNKIREYYKVYLRTNEV